MIAWFEGLDRVWRMGCVILAVLVAGSLVVALLRSAKPHKDYTELSARMRSWWFMATVFFGAVVLQNRISFIFFAAVSFWAMKEYVTLLKTRPADHKTLVLTFLAIPVQYLWVDIEWYGMFVIFIPVYMFIMLPLRLLFSKETSGFVASASQIQWGLMSFVFGLSHMAYLLTFKYIGANETDGRMLILFLVFVVEMSDVLQYVCGKTIGRHKMMPTVSPNKTWEGFLGGIACATVLSLSIRFLTPFSVLECLGVAFLICIAGFGGGAVMSAVKRDFGVKDFGAIIPGHGGMLDRVDSLCYAAPVFFHYVRNFYT
jgi:phosphatidate cytidylyltransferase